jgi:hypothetical protein
LIELDEGHISLDPPTLCMTIPAGGWVKIALTVSHGLPLPTSARLMAC